MDVDAVLMLIFGLVVIFGGLFITVSRASGTNKEKKKNKERVKE